jgi:hypothetical protein
LRKRPEKKQRGRFDDDYLKKAEKIESRKRKADEVDEDGGDDEKTKAQPNKVVKFENGAGNKSRPPAKAKFLGFSKKRKAIFKAKQK